MNKANEYFMNEYGMSLEAAFNNVISGKMSMDEVVTSDEFFDYMYCEKGMLWGDLRKAIKNNKDN